MLCSALSKVLGSLDNFFALLTLTALRGKMLRDGVGSQEGWRRVVDALNTMDLGSLQTGVCVCVCARARASYVGLSP